MKLIFFVSFTVQRFCAGGEELTPVVTSAVSLGQGERGTSSECRLLGDAAWAGAEPCPAEYLGVGGDG